MGPPPAKAETGPDLQVWNYQQPALHLGYGDGAFRANFHTSLTAEALIHVHGISLAVYHLKNLSRTSVCTFFIAGTFVFINIYLPHN
jgi:hypothetical protein